jgi:hypothetical protein
MRVYRQPASASYGAAPAKSTARSCRRAAWRCMLGFSFGHRHLPREHASQLSTSSIMRDHVSEYRSATRLRADAPHRQPKVKSMSDVRLAAVFDANLPNLSRSVRINSFYDAQVFVRRWAIRDKDRAIRVLVRRMERANSSEAASSAIEELKRELAARGLLP